MINGRSLFVVSTEGALFERFWNAKVGPNGDWTWVDHGTPSHGSQSGLLAQVRGVAVHPQSLFFAMVDGRIAELQQLTERQPTTTVVRWIWRIQAVPEGGPSSSVPAEYCNPDPSSPNNCIKGYCAEGPGMCRGSDQGIYPNDSPLVDASGRG